LAQIGRISGPLLTANLERNGADLAFRNDLDTTQLLYLDVNNNRIGVNTSTPSYELDVVGTLQTVNLIAPNTVSPLAGFSLANSTFTAIGDLNLNASEAIVMPALSNDTLLFNDNYIASTISNASIDLTPHGTGTTDIYNRLDVRENMFTTGDITLGGTLTFGDQDTDNVVFNADISTDIIPDASDTYSLGSTTKRWNQLYTDLVNGQTVSTSSISIGLIDFNRTQGNIFYVAQNGTDTNFGDNIFSPVASIRRALELADGSDDGPVTIYVFPGDYEEETPLVVPSNVSIIGTDIRNVNVFPTSYTLSEDVFHLNGETTIANLTIRDFYFDDNKGYAFRFAPDGIISSRSPYIQNCTIITKGTNITADDPLGFDSEDAGRGAYIDGAELNSSTVEASMLFHSVTFITPGVDTITMTNGVRVEWLNSFTYYANRGLYAFNNSTGRIMQDGSTISYGAEVRSIGSANVYGNYGAVADGDDTLMYLIGHNFAYVGAGKETSNDNSLTIQANEVVEENSGQIHYVTTDQSGAFRVGDNFYVDFETGSTSVNIDSLVADSLTGLVITTGADQTIIAGDKVETGNIRIRNNTFETLISDLNVDTATNEINYTGNTNISNNLSVVGDLSFDGSLNLLGNQASDTLKLNVDLDQDFNPNTTLAFKLGSPSKQWLLAHLSRLEVGDISVYDNIVETNVSNADLELRANGTGIVKSLNLVNISNDLTVSGILTSDDTITVNGNLTQTGGITQDGSLAVTGDVTVNQNITVNRAAQFEEILVDDNVITTTSSDADLELRASGAGEITVPNNNVEIQNNLSADNIFVDNNFTVTLATTFDVAEVSNITITDNYVSSNVSNADLELRANGNGQILIANNNVQIDNNLTVGGDVDLQDIAITGTLTQTGNRTQVGSYTQTGNVSLSGNLTTDRKIQFENISIDGNVITTTVSNSDLDLRASGTGRVLIPSNNVQVNNNLFTASIIAGNISVDTDLVLNEIVIPPSIIEIDDNFISTKTSNADLDLRASGNGSIIFENTTSITNNLEVVGNTNLQSSIINGDITHSGNSVTTGNYLLTGNLSVFGNVDFSSSVEFEDIKIDGNVITTTLSNSNIELRASGSGNVLIDENLQINNNLTVGTLSSSNITINDSFALEELESSTDIQIFDNVITTTNSNSNLELRGAGTGSVYLQTLEFSGNTIGSEATPDSTPTDITFTTDVVDIDSTGSLQIPVGSTELATQGSIKYDSTSGLFEGFNSSVITLTGVYSDDRKTSVTAHPTNNTILFEVDETQVGYVDNTGLTIHGLQVDDISVDSNIISTTVSNSDLELRSPGTGELVIDNTSIIDNSIKNNSAALVLANTGFGKVKINNTFGLVFPHGSTADRAPSPEIGDTRWNTDIEILETWDGNQYITAAGTSATISESEFNDLLLEYTLIFG
jgi:cytoskeletal protein CcmA (bactofilin family)